MSRIKLSNGDIAKVIDTKQYKALKSKKYNFLFIKSNGLFVRWGKSKTITTVENDIQQLEYDFYHIWKNIWNDDVDILQFISDLKVDAGVYNTPIENIDWEISNSKKTTSFSDFKKMFSKLPKSLYSIHFIIDKIEDNSDIWKILKYTQKHDVVPTFTINNGISDEQIDSLIKLCGSINVNIKDLNDSCNYVKMLTDKGLEKCNLIIELSDNTIDYTIKLIKDFNKDERLSKLTSIIFSVTKNKIGISQEKTDELFNYSFANNINVSFDSCISSTVVDFLKRNEQYSNMTNYVDYCNASIYSCYINANGDYYPCLYCDNKDNWKRGISVLTCKDFIKDIWLNKRTRKFRDTITKCKNCTSSCPLCK